MKVNTDNGFPSGKSQCLLVGNGINLLFSDPSWKKLIEEELAQSHSPLSYEEIKGMPATMQIVAATDDDVSNRMKVLSEKLLNLNMTPERTTFLQKLMSLPVDDVMTANYSFELETADGMTPTKSGIVHTFEVLLSCRPGTRLFACISSMKHEPVSVSGMYMATWRNRIQCSWDIITMPNS